MSIEVDPPRKGGVWRWVLLVGCGLLLLGLGTCAGVAFLGYGLVKDTVIMDPARIDAVAGQILPGAGAPPGYEAQMAMDVAGFKTAAYAPSGPRQDACAVALILFPMKPSEFDWQVALDKMDQQDAQDGQRVLSTALATLSLGGREVPGLQRVVEEKGVRKNQKAALFGTPDKKVALVMLEWPEGESEDPAFAAFGARLRLEGYAALGAPSPGPASEPGSGPAEAEPSPAP